MFHTEIHEKGKNLKTAICFQTFDEFRFIKSFVALFI